MGPTRVLRYVLPDCPRPMLSQDEPLTCRRTLSVTEHEHLARHSQEDLTHARLCKMQETVAQRVFPFQAWHTLKIVVAGLRQQAGLTLCIVVKDGFLRKVSVSSGGGLKRAHGDSIVNGDKEQPGIRALDFSSDCRSTRSECWGPRRNWQW